MKNVLYIVKGYGNKIILTINANTDPFSLLGSNKVSNDNNIRNTFASFFRFLMAIGIIGIIISIIISGIKISSKNSNTREEGKKLLQTKAIIAITIFSFVALMGMIFEIIVKLV